MFKVRASYGELGNENIGEYMYQAVMSRNNMTYNFNGNVVTGSAVSTFVDSNLAWEKKKTYNVGIDLALFRNRLEFTAEWYKNISEDLLYAVPVPEQAGVSNTTVTMNAASMNNPVSNSPPPTAIGIMISNMKYRAISVRCVTV